MRFKIHRWIKQCPHYRLIFCWCRRGQEVVFSWPVSLPFAIICIDLWMFSKYTDSNGNVILMDTMGNISQFVVVALVPDESSTILANYFFQHVLMKFGVCHLVVLDDGTPFKGAFVNMCKALDLNYDILAKRNHKGLLVENFHHLFNKGTAIVMEDRKSNDVLVPARIATCYHEWDWRKKT